MADDRRIDESLRDVPLPQGLQDRVGPDALFDDAALDRLLARVAVPAGLPGRIRTAVFTPGKGRGVDLDRAAGLVPAFTPDGPPGRRGRLGRLAAAVAVHGGSLAVSLAALAVLIVAGLELARRVEPAGLRQPIVLTAQPLPEAAPREPAVGMAIGDAEPFGPPAVPDTAALAAGAADHDAAPPVVEPALRQPDAPAIRGAAVGAAARSATVDGGMRVVAVARGDSRRSVPRVAAFDMAFEMTHGESPFVDPRKAATLAIDRPPLTVRTDAFEELLGGRKQRPGATPALRTEELLAAVPSPAAPRSGEPQVVIRGMRGLRGQSASCLVEVCVVAPPVVRSTARPLDAVLVLERPAGGEPLPWGRICRAVDAVAERMRAGDRVTVIVGGLRPRVAGSRLDASGLRRLAAALATEPADGDADFDATMRLARAETAGSAERPLVVVATVNAVDRSRGEGRAAVTEWRESLVRADAAARNPTPARFVLVDPAEPAERETDEPDFGRTPADGLELSRAVVGRVFGGDTLAARQCRLEVRFDPRAVAAYRLVGHRQSAMESLSGGGQTAIDLHAGETARAVYEIVPLAADGTAVTATLAYRPAGGGPERSVTASLPLRAVEPGPLPSPHGCELLLAAALGELVSGSPYAEPRRPTAQSAADLAAAWRSRGDVTAFGESLIDAGERLGILKPPKPPSSPPR